MLDYAKTPCKLKKECEVGRIIKFILSVGLIKRFSRKSWLIATVLVTLFVVLFGFLRVKNKASNVIGEVRRGPILEAVYGIGTVFANRTYQFKVGFADIVADVYVKEGDFVRKGSRLVVLGNGAQLVAPFSGTVTSLSCKNGEAVFPQLPILTLTDLKDRYIVASLEQRSAMRVVVGQNVRLSFEGARDQAFDGKINSVYSNKDGYLVRISASKLPAAVLPGMTVDVAIAIREHKESLVVPVSAINSGHIWIEGIGGPKKVSVEVGNVDEGFAQITTGDIKEGDRVLSWIS